MQKYFFILLLTILAIHAKATIRTVSNYPANLAQFNDIQAAINASNTSDTIYVHGSPNGYGGFVMTDKKLTIIGPGYLPDKAFPYTAIFNASYLNGDLCSGSKFEGLVFTNQIGISGGDSIQFLRNYFNGAYLDLSSTPNATGYRGYVIEGNFFKQNSNVIIATYPVSNTSIQNNVFYNGVLQNLQNGVNVLINHNLFYGTTNTTSVCFSNCNGLVLSNNIFVRRDAGTGNLNSTFNNNITYLCAENTPWNMNGNINLIGNIANQSPQMADEALVEAGSLSLLLSYTITAGPANNSGSDTKDMGLLFDPTGFYNWVNSRYSRLPYLFKMNIYNPVIQTNGTITVNIEARKNN
jgi:hypothetical protein